MGLLLSLVADVARPLGLIGNHCVVCVVVGGNYQQQQQQSGVWKARNAHTCIL